MLPEIYLHINTNISENEKLKAEKEGTNQLESKLMKRFALEHFYFYSDDA